MVSRILAIALVTAASSMTGAMSAQRQAPQGPAQGPTVQVYKTPTCGCCANWVKHLQANGFATRVMDIENLSEIKTKHNIPAAAQSCHTATVDGYVLEGHVPAADVRRLLKERPAVLGLAVPGMPIGSPGMEVPNVKPSPYNVMSFDRRGQLKVYSSH
jgi:hypothetical protein